MLCLYLLLISLTHAIRAAHVADTTLTKRFDRLYQKLEKLNAATDREQELSPQEKLLEKLDKLNSLAPEREELSEEDVELLATMQMFGRLSAEQVDGMAKDLQRMKERRFESEQDYNDAGWDDEEPDDYPMDGSYDWVDAPEASSTETSSTARPQIFSVTPSAIIKNPPVRHASPIVSAIKAIAATNARPQILSDPMSREETRALRITALNSVMVLIRSGKCSVPQPRWLTIKQLAPAADTNYLPSCVQLHRCAPDSGCCINEGEVCAPIAGENITLPIFLHKADGNMNVVKMQFFNHTECACISRSNLQTSDDLSQPRVGKPSLSNSEEGIPVSAQPEEKAASKIDEEKISPKKEERQNDWRPPVPTEEPIVPEVIEVTSPPQLRRCTCPALFIAKITMSSNEPCSCVCEWPDSGRRRECQSLARGKEHFGLRDRVCVAAGDCTPPTCDYGAYDKTYGTCPARRIRRIRYHRGRYPGKMIVL